MKQAERERLRDYLTRFSVEMTQIESCDPKTATMAFRGGLIPTGHLYESLIRKPPTNMADVLSRVEGYIRLEDNVSFTARKATTVVMIGPSRKDAHPPKKQSYAMSQKGEEKSGNSHPPRGKKFVATPLTMPIWQVWHENKVKGYFTTPFPIRSPFENRDQACKCEFHNEVGHTIEECRSLRRQIKNLIRDGHLAHYVAQ
ncbi:hypothetical protein QJS04_geneDACA010876 [Acorus gramineus]|uniref:Retrotransposon gag domain-containing protein n=1 Tax=Acorus gramineus TaxID=55184 RepID=A0AAV9BBA0_ACOGR|nr:hypothetical protein QJS04_geneDACA010876 [Acorus gramineus]